jgi:hypothetical protein
MIDNFQIQIYKITALIIYIYRSSMENCVESKSGPNERKCRARGGLMGSKNVEGLVTIHTRGYVQHNKPKSSN